MTLLQSITLASAEADAGILSPFPKFPTILNSDAILPTLRPSSSSPSAAPIKPLTGWAIPSTDADLAALSSHLSAALTRKLGAPKSLTRADFLVPLNAFLINAAEKFRISVALPPSDPGFTITAMEKFGFLIGRDLSGPISDCCVLLHLWDVLESLVRHGLVGNLNSTKLIANLVQHNQPDLLCLCVERIPDLRSADILAVLKCFLSPSKDCFTAMAAVRKRWEGEALLAVEKATRKGESKKVSRLAKQAAVLLMMAHDGFSAAELCLHHLFGSGNLDDLVLASAFSRLDGSEVLRLVRYLVKWVEKYQRFPEAAPCPKAGSVLGLTTCERVPSLEDVAGVLGLVLDEHYSYLVLNPKFHDEMRTLQKAVDYLATEARSCYPVDDIIKHLNSERVKQRGE